MSLGVSQQGSLAAGKAGAATGRIIRGLVPAARELTSTLLLAEYCSGPGTVRCTDTQGSGPHVEAEQNKLLRPDLGRGPRARRRRVLGGLGPQRMLLTAAAMAPRSWLGPHSAIFVPPSL